MDARIKIQKRHYDALARTKLLSNPPCSGSKELLPEFRAPYKFFEKWLVEQNLANKKILDYGCGNGLHSILPAKLGAFVIGVDISRQQIKLAQQRAVLEGVKHSTRFETENCESLRFMDNSFDIVFSSGTLSYLELDKAYSEIARVLKPDGTAVLIDTLGHNAFLNRRRMNKLKKNLGIRWSVEHILKLKDFYKTKDYFKKFEIRFFDFFTLIVAFLNERKRLPAFIAKPAILICEQLDKIFLPALPFKTWAFKAVCILSEPKKKNSKNPRVFSK